FYPLMQLIIRDLIYRSPLMRNKNREKYTQANYLYLIKISQCPSKAMTHLYIVRAPSLGKTEA
ncbi:hypothetical protein, partial [Coprobacter fastidiosus]|uniref:hypothetical protein n=1 Tax=Coprobacter fastidiosus TaxID=1099853 RepID=UPI002666C00B